MKDSKKEIRELTKAEEQIMQVLWDLEAGYVKDVIAQLPEPKPAYNTVSTIIRILEEKGFVSHRAYGKTYEYFPVVDKERYSSFYLKSFVGRFFDGSFNQMVSFFVKRDNLDIKDLDSLLKSIQDDDGENTQGETPQKP